MVPNTIRKSLEVLVFLEYFRNICLFKSKYTVFCGQSLLFWAKHLLIPRKPQSPPYPTMHVYAKGAKTFVLQK